jgi:hypothetical protein
MVSVQAACSPDEALVLMTDHARATGQNVEAVASGVIARLVRFDQAHAS